MLKLEYDNIGVILGYMFREYKNTLGLQMGLYDWIYFIERNGIL